MKWSTMTVAAYQLLDQCVCLPVNGKWTIKRQSNGISFHICVCVCHCQWHFALFTAHPFVKLFDSAFSNKPFENYLLSSSLIRLKPSTANIISWIQFETNRMQFNCTCLLFWHWFFRSSFQYYSNCHLHLRSIWVMRFIW